MNNIEVKEVSNKSELNKFIYLPDFIHKEHDNWVPPIYMDEKEFFDKNKNTNFKKNDTILFLAYKDGIAVGRVMGIIPKVYNHFFKENNARFNYLDTIDDIDVAKSLIDAVKTWALSFKKDKLIGPLGFSDKEPQGFLYEGYNEPHVIASTCNYPYQTQQLIDLGFVKHKDLFVYKVDLSKDLPEFYNALAQRNLRYGYKLIEFSSKLQARKYIHPILKLVNITYKDIYASTPFSEDEMDDFANKYMMVLNANLIKVIVDKNDEVVAFVVAMRDMGKGLKIAKGRLLPVGFIPFLYHQKRSKQLNLLLGAVANDHRNRGLDALLGTSLFDSAKKLGMDKVDTHLILEENIKMRKEIERIDGEIYKRYRLYTLDL